MSPVTEQPSAPARPVYTNKLELLLTLVGYAVGFGNIWRFPYLAYSFGGGAFLIPYFLSLALLGIPLFVLELGLGQIFRQGTLGVWQKLGLPRLRGVGAAATLCTFFVSLYYTVILAWTLYYLGCSLGALFAGEGLPWGDLGDCPESVLVVREAVASSPFLFDATTGLFNRSYAGDFWCPANGVPRSDAVAPPGFVKVTARPRSCPGEAALKFWQTSALQQSSGLTDLGGIHPGMFAAFTVAWLLTYLCIFNGIKTSGKVVYVTATLPYIALVTFFVRAMTLPNAGVGVSFFVTPDFGLLASGQVWLRAVTQIFYSLGVGFGSLIAFSSYGPRHSNFVGDASKVALINCGTSIFCGFVVFPILGYLAHELSEVNPCIRSGDLAGLASVGLSGTGLAFVAFPIAISRMPGGHFWSLLFFVMLFCLGIDSEFAMVESIVTVLSDAGVGRSWRRPSLAGVVCLISYLVGLIFVTRGGIYWFELFDSYSCVISMFFVTGLECIGLMWYDRSTWPCFQREVTKWTGIELGLVWKVLWKFIAPGLIITIAVLSLNSWDVMGARESKPFPIGMGFFPTWSIVVGWVIGLLPLVLALGFAVAPVPKDVGASNEDITVEAEEKDSSSAGKSGGARGAPIADGEVAGSLA